MDTRVVLNIITIAVLHMDPSNSISGSDMNAAWTKQNHMRIGAGHLKSNMHR